jgi:hypothetical protein
VLQYYWYQNGSGEQHPMPNAPVPVHSTGLPTFLPRHTSYADEFLDLMEQRRRLERRLDELVEIIDCEPSKSVKLPIC